MSDAPGREDQILGIYHFNINTADLDRSQAFYELLGFEVVDRFHMKGQADHDEGLGLKDVECRAIFMKVGNNKHATYLDIAQWINPPLQQRPTEITSVGVPRFAMRVKNIDALVARLKKHGVEFFTEQPATIGILARKPRFICARDPDGLIVEFVEMTQK
jgi:catechol 2,3-dioxygenase-like lactoylglutathione lyase family enzyme